MQNLSLFVGITIIMPLIGVGLLVAAFFSFRAQRRKAGVRSATAVGVVVGLQREQTTAGSPGVDCPIVEFVGTGGEMIRFQSSFGSLPAMHKKGQTVTVSYDPDDPHDAEVKSTLSRWFVPGLMAAIGLLFLLVGFFLFSINVILYFAAS